jgi:hypothetical protein
VIQDKELTSINPSTYSIQKLSSGEGRVMEDSGKENVTKEY